MRATPIDCCRAVLLVAVLGLTAYPTGACCGPPPYPGLWEALAEADAVVVARIDQVSPTLASQGGRLARQAHELRPRSPARALIRAHSPTTPWYHRIRSRR